MLERLRVAGLGIIDDVELELEPGFAALTGETGAGKSLLVESLELLAGGRASVDLIRTGDERLRLEASFRVGREPGLHGLLEELGIETGERLELRRELTAAGRSRCWVNDVAVAVATLQRLAPFLLSIHGQHEQHGLADAAEQRRLVDLAAGHDELLGEVRCAYRAWSEAAAESRRLAAAAAARRDRLDAIAFQLAEIDAVAPAPGEDEELRGRRRVLRSSGRLAELAAAALGRLVDNEPAVLDELTRAGREVEEMAACGLEVVALAERLGEARVLTEDAVSELQQRVAELEHDPDDLDRLESRLYRLEQLTLKYGEPVERVLEHRAALLAEREEFDLAGDRLEHARKLEGEVLARYDRSAAVLDSARRSAAARFAAEVGRVLERLAMAGTRLDFSWSTRPDPSSPLRRGGIAVAFDEDGVEECELQLAANPGEEPRPMARIASGGELSRLHLALRTVLRGRRGAEPLTLLFDEVDSGLGGATAAALAGLLADLARTDQVLVVTHLPQVAARATAQLRVEKVLVDGRSVTRVQRLAPAERELELARMLAGEAVGPSARAHARALLDS